MNKITSSSNPLIKGVKQLKERKYREERQMFFIEGVRFVEEAFKKKLDLEQIFISDKLTEVKGGKMVLDLALASNTRIYELEDKLFREISDTENPQGILAVVKIKRCELEELLGENSFIVVLDSIQDPGNMGTIIRTADAVGATGIIISKGCVDLYNPKVLRSTMGSVFHLPFYFSSNIVEAISLLKSRGVRVLASHLEANSDFYNLDLDKDVAIVIGNEASGINREVADCADQLVKIPMPGEAESLNASVAAGVLMYEVVRQRMKK